MSKRNRQAASYQSDHAAVHLDGIRLADGRQVLPGLSNSFELRQRVSFVARHRVWLINAGLGFGAPLTVAGLLIVGGLLSWFGDRRFDEMALAQFNFGDVVALRPNRRAAPVLEIDEIFGNEFVRDKDKVAEDGEDPRVAGAVQAFASGVSPPVDLSPEIVPEYSAEARSRGLQGKVFLEIVVADDGSTLRVRVAKGIDPLLDSAAAAAYRRKRWAPSRGADGKPVTIKFIQPVNFVLQ
ncbi:MAG: energy transducer TonB [Leptospirales bacterium]|nr:energy transducer TonB [Leptospirales bacterium]